MSQIQLPDGNMLDFPDNPTKDDLAKLAAIKEKAAGGKSKPTGTAPEKPFLPSLEETKNAILGGLARGAKGMADITTEGMRHTPGIGQFLQGSDIVSELLGRKLGQDVVINPRAASATVGKKLEEELPVPESSGGRFLNAVMENAPGALAGPGSLVGKVLSATGGGIGSQAAANVFGDNMLTRLFGGLAGGYAGSRLAGATIPSEKLPSDMPSRRALKVLRPATEGVSDADWQQAFDNRHLLERELGAMSNPGDTTSLVSQYFPSNARLDSIAQLLAAHESGGNVRGTVRSQAEAVDNLMKTLPNRFGFPENPRDAGALVQQTAQDRLQQMKTGISNRAAEGKGNIPGYNDVEFTSQQKQDIKATLKGWIDQNASRLPEKSIAAARDFIEQLDRRSLDHELTNANPNFPPNVLRAAFEDAMDKYKPAFPGPQSSAAEAGMRELRGLGKSTAQDGNRDYKAADAFYAAMKEGSYNPLKEGVIGKLAGRGVQPGQQPLMTWKQVFDAGTPVADNSDILKMAKELSRVNKDAFPTAAGSWLREKVARIETPATGQGRYDTNTAQAYWDTFFKTDAQKQGMRDIAAGVAKSRGESPTPLLRGVDNLASIMDLVRRRPSISSGVTAEEVMGKAGRSLQSDLLSVAGYIPFLTMKRRMELSNASKTLAEIDKLLTTPEGLDTLRRIGKYDFNGRQGQMALRAAMTQIGTLTAEDQQDKKD